MRRSAADSVIHSERDVAPVRYGAQSGIDLKTEVSGYHTHGDAFCPALARQAAIGIPGSAGGAHGAPCGRPSHDFGCNIPARADDECELPLIVHAVNRLTHARCGFQRNTCQGRQVVLNEADAMTLAAARETSAWSHSATLSV
jgi:hypothetical protein